MNIADQDWLMEVEGTFDGESLWGQDGKIYPVHENYASKSKLVEGDTLKLYIQRDGRFVFKQTSPVERRRVIGKVNASLGVSAEDRDYKVLLSSMTYNHAAPGDTAVIVLPATGNPTWAALESIIKDRSLDRELNLNEDDNFSGARK